MITYLSCSWIWNEAEPEKGFLAGELPFIHFNSVVLNVANMSPEISLSTIHPNKNCRPLEMPEKSARTHSESWFRFHPEKKNLIQQLRDKITLPARSDLLNSIFGHKIYQAPRSTFFPAHFCILFEFSGIWPSILWSFLLPIFFLSSLDRKKCVVGVMGPVFLPSFSPR